MTLDFCVSATLHQHKAPLQSAVPASLGPALTIPRIDFRGTNPNGAASLKRLGRAAFALSLSASAAVYERRFQGERGTAVGTEGLVTVFMSELSAHTALCVYVCLNRGLSSHLGSGYAKRPPVAGSTVHMHPG